MVFFLVAVAKKAYRSLPPPPTSWFSFSASFNFYAEYMTLLTLIHVLVRPNKCLNSFPQFHKRDSSFGNGSRLTEVTYRLVLLPANLARKPGINAQVFIHNYICLRDKFVQTRYSMQES